MTAIRIAALLFTVATVPALAQGPYTIARLGPNTPLELSAEPRIGSRTVKTYPPGQTGIHVLRSQGQWRQVSLSPGGPPDGWVNQMFLFDPNVPATVRYPLRCMHGEPFFTFTVRSAQQATFATEEEPETRMPIRSAADADRGVSLRMDRAGSAEITPGSCSDGYNDRSFRYRLRLTLPDGRSFSGCCR